MLPWDLEDWLTDEGDRLVRSDPATSHSWSTIDKAIYGIWLLDTEARNGGLSQHFYNFGREQWASCLAAVRACSIAPFERFAEVVNSVIGSVGDAGSLIQRSGNEAEGLWSEHQEAVVASLRSAASEA